MKSRRLMTTSAAAQAECLQALPLCREDQQIEMGGLAAISRHYTMDAVEIEKRTIDGRPYQTGGGRTIDANSIDILLTWLVNCDREFLQGGATGATKPGMKVFPYFATPNTELRTVADSVELAAAPDTVWSLIGQFGGDWHPLVARVSLIGTGVGQLRKIETLDRKEIVERLDAIDNAKRFYRYELVAGIPASRYTGTLEV